MTIITDETAGAARSRTDLIAGFNGLIDEIAVRGADYFPQLVSIQLPVPPGLGHEGKRAWLDRVAAQWGAEILFDGMGGEWAEKSFGAVRLVASVANPDRGVLGYEARATAHGLRSSTARNQNGATA
jgi:hypothetical protein